MSVTFANGGANNYQGNANSSGAGVACANASSAGNTMIILASAGQIAATMNGLTFNDGTNTYPLIDSAVVDPGGNFSLAIYCGPIATGLAGGYVLKGSGVFTTQIRAIEIVGAVTVDNGGAVAKSQSSLTTGGTISTSNLVCTGTNGKILMIGMENTSANTLAVAGGATSLGTVSSVARLAAYLDYITTGTYNAQMSVPTAGTQQALIALALVAAGGGGGGAVLSQGKLPFRAGFSEMSAFLGT